MGKAKISKQRTRKFVTKIVRKTCPSLVKLFLTERIILHKISTNRVQKISAKNVGFFAQNKYKSANMGSSTFQLHGADLIDIQIQN